MLLPAGCNTKPEEFTSLSFTMETVGIYKSSIEISKDKSYQIKQQNIFFDYYAGKERINTSQGYLSDEEFAELSELIIRSRLFKMKDAYGFDQEADTNNPISDVIYQLTYTEGKKIKYISIRDNPGNRYSENFLQLLRFLNRYMSDQQKMTEN